MRIVYYVVGWPPERFQNGIVSATDCLAPAIRSAGHEARILAYYGDPDPGENDVYFVEAAGARSREFSPMRALRNKLSPHRDLFEGAARRIARRINEVPDLKNADIVEMEESYGWSAQIARRVSTPVVTRLHGPWFMNGAAQTEGVLTRFDRQRVRREGAAIAAAEAISAPSQFVLDAVRRYYSLDLSAAAVIPNPASPVPEAAGWRADRADPNEILFVGRFDRHKGADIVLRAFAILAGARPTLKLTFAGPNSAILNIDGRTYNCRDYIDALMPPEAARRVALLGPTPKASLTPLRERAYLTVIGSRVEVFPNVALEALACGSPLVATRVGGIPEIARDGVEALFTPSEDVAAMAAAIATLLDNRDFAISLGEAGRRRAEADFAPPAIASRTIEFYRTVLARRTAGGDRKRTG